MIAWLRRWLAAAEDQAFSWFQVRCRHPGHMVRADILEGEIGPDRSVRWCGRCGAYGRGPTMSSGWGPLPHSWRRPMAEWTGDL